jgi:quinohemoprotein ethanol dehydrogenase
MRKVLMQAPKNGFFYVLDRETGELLSAEPYVAVNWASHIDPETGRPVETGLGDYAEGARLVYPAPTGGHSWHPMAFHPGTGLVYIPAHDIQFWFVRDESFEFRMGEYAIAIDTDELVDLTEKDPPEARGFLLAWDPVAQKEVWRVAHEGFWNGGVLATAGGLVFQGSGDGRIAAHDAATGARLWAIRSHTGIMAPPISYEIDGEQYVAVAAGWGGGVIAGGRVEQAIITEYHNEGRVLAFKLGGSQPMPRSTRRDLTVPAPPPLTVSAEEVLEGKSLYNRHCLACHGMLALSSLVVPDLRYMSDDRHEAFESIVLGGALRGNGMPSFSEFLTSDDLPGVQGYIISRAQDAYDAQLEPDE